MSIVIVNFNARDLLSECLESIFQRRPARTFEVIVVDNASSDGSVELIRQRFPEVGVIANRVNGGFARANNQALSACRSRYALLLNPDTRVVGRALDDMAEFADSRPEIGILGPQLINPDGSLQPSGNSVPSAWRQLLDLLPLAGRRAVRGGSRYVQEGRDYSQIEEVEEVSGACMLLRREVLDQVGLLDDRYFFCFEDVDYCLRARAAGWKIVYFPDAKVIHHWGGSSGGGGWRLAVRYLEGLHHFWGTHYGRGMEFVGRMITALKSVCKLSLALLAHLGTTGAREAFLSNYALLVCSCVPGRTLAWSRWSQERRP